MNLRVASIVKMLDPSQLIPCLCHLFKNLSLLPFNHHMMTRHHFRWAEKNRDKASSHEFKFNEEIKEALI